MGHLRTVYESLSKIISLFELTNYMYIYMFRNLRVTMAHRILEFLDWTASLRALTTQLKYLDEDELYDQ